METNGKWISGLPLSKQTTRTKDGSSWTDKTVYTYDSDSRPQTKTGYTNNGTKQVSYEEYAYDSFGNQTTQSVKSYAGSKTFMTSYEYDSQGIFLKKVTDPQGRTEEYGYNVYGQRTSSKDYLGQTTGYEYDGMGRLNKTTRPGGVVTDILLGWTQTPNTATYYIRETTSGQPTVTTYYDAIGREVRNSTQLPDGSESKIDRTYNVKDWLPLQSEE